MMLHRSVLLRAQHLRTLSQISMRHKWTGSDPGEHVTNSSDKSDIQTQASQAGREDKSQDNQGLANSATERDQQGSQKKVKEEFPEAPKGPVIGMNDERGSVGVFGCVLLDPERCGLMGFLERCLVKVEDAWGLQCWWKARPESALLKKRGHRMEETGDI